LGHTKNNPFEEKQTDQSVLIVSKNDVHFKARELPPAEAGGFQTEIL